MLKLVDHSSSVNYVFVTVKSVVPMRARPTRSNRKGIRFWRQKKIGRIVMSRKENHPFLADEFKSFPQADSPRHLSWPDAAEGHRLMRAFLNIRTPAVRDAIITFVTELSAADDGKTEYFA